MCCVAGVAAVGKCANPVNCGASAGTSCAWKAQALQIKYLNGSTQQQRRDSTCACGPQEGFMPIPLVEACQHEIRLYTGKTIHSESESWCLLLFAAVWCLACASVLVCANTLCDSSGTDECWHEVQLVDAIRIYNWEDAALALSLMQSVVFNFKRRLTRLMGQEGDAVLQGIATSRREDGMTILRDAGVTTPARDSFSDHDDIIDEAGAGAGPVERLTPLSAAHALVAEDVSALAVAGASGASLMAPLPMPLMFDEDAVSSNSNDSLRSFVGESASTASVQPLVRGHVQMPAVPSLAPCSGAPPARCANRRSRGVIRACGRPPAVMARHSQ